MKERKQIYETVGPNTVFDGLFLYGVSYRPSEFGDRRTISLTVRVHEKDIRTVAEVVRGFATATGCVLGIDHPHAFIEDDPYQTTYHPPLPPAPSYPTPSGG